MLRNLNECMLLATSERERLIPNPLPYLTEECKLSLIKKIAWEVGEIAI